ncbi:Utp21-domain-containing protein [Suhomyces tanzawaensis NRRL Y-17324]|uniref:Utp21-domain-containing protein n=1 Tax=Suhomyces tanzawaensis NRRL Y-17324 TaxID=984487 RepID=A0A1E4SJU3_9ASCO|nr:Utp21-domain-containing protein [Suhomyces tanzawaensis NRRL Y-17324]ODV79760.1 Utp21-domain-containing protein [Suhomyces tanzawaensis NRRL Y-17324]
MVEAEKRRKVEETAVKGVSKPSKIFSPFRVVGNVSNEVPFAIGTLGSTFYAVTSVGRSFQIYDIATLHLLFVSQTQTPSKITCLSANYHYVYAGYGNQVGIFKRGKLEHTLVCDTKETVNHILVFGDFLVATVADGEVFVFKKPSGSKIPSEFYTKIQTINSSVDGAIVGLIHPPTYLNKIVVATTSGLFLFNIRTGKLLYRSPEHQFMDGISCVEPAPVLDVIAVGSPVGNVQLYNLKKGKAIGQKIVVSTQDVSAKVVSLSFRTDGSPHLVAGLNTGDLFFYDLAKRSRVHILRNAHKESHGGIANVQFLNGQPIIVTNGGDNHLKEFVFDPTLSTTNSSVVSPPRHLRSRGGHSAPPIAIEFPNEEKTHFLYSASRDRSFWSFSLRKDAQAQEMSQRAQKTLKRRAGPVGSMREKFSEIIAITSSQSREGEWENILTAHKDETFARTWDSRSKRVGRHQLNTVDGGIVKSVCISQCGNFGFVGSSTGGIGAYNLQSGLLRKKYMLHKKAVTGLAIDGMNRRMVSSGLDGILGFYDFNESKYLGKLQLDAPITFMIYHRSSDLIACALDDLSIVVVDVITQKVVRVLFGHSNRITGMDFSPDGRWIVSVALDSTIRTWDLPTGGCIDGVRLPNVATSVKFSPLGDLLATTHVSGNGVSLWTNRSQFKPISTRHVEEEDFSTILLPNVSGDGGSTLLDGAFEEEDQVIDVEQSYTSAEQIDESLVTLSLGPRSKYSTLLHLDTIKQRSKPKEAPKKSEKTPFFLSLSGEAVGDRASVAEGKVAEEQGANQDEDDETSKLHRLRKGDNYTFESKFTQLLREGAELGDFSEFLAYLVQASPAVVDLEIRSINEFPPLTEMISFIKAMIQGMESKTNYDLYQAFFAMFLKNHADIIANNPNDDELQISLQVWARLNDEIKDEMDALVKYCSGVINFVNAI